MKQIFLLFLLLTSLFPPVFSSEGKASGRLTLSEETQSIDMFPFNSSVNVTQNSIPNNDGFRTEYPVDGVEGVFDIKVASDQLIWFSVLEDNQLWSLNRSAEQILSYTLPQNITPFLIKEDDDGSLWFTDYDFTPYKHYDGLIHFNPKTLNGTYYKLNVPQTGPFDILLYRDKVWFTQWLKGIVAILDPISGEISTLGIENEKYADLPCGPVGLTLASNGKIWVVETLCSILVEINPETMDYNLHPLPSDFYSPVFLSEDPEGNLWTGDHSGNRMLKFNPETGVSESVLVVPPTGGVWGFAGINEVQFDPEGRLWFAEHFVNKIGYYDTKSRHVYEFKLPQPDPLIQWIDLNGTDLWYGIYTEGKIGLIEGNKVPEVEITVEKTTFQSKRVSQIPIEMNVQVPQELVGVRARSIVASENADQIYAGKNEEKDLSSVSEFDLSINIGNNIELGSFPVLIGIEIDSMVVTIQLSVEITQNLFYTVFIQGLGPIALLYTIGFIRRSRKVKNE